MGIDTVDPVGSSQSILPVVPAATEQTVEQTEAETPEVITEDRDIYGSTVDTYA